MCHGRAAVQVFKRASRHMTATLIVVTSESGRAATMVTKYRPPCLVVVASTNETVSATDTRADCA